MRKTVLLVAYEPGIALQVFLCLQAMGAVVHVAANPHAAHLRLSLHCRSFTAIDLAYGDGNEALVGRIDQLARQVGAEMILPADEISTRLLVKVHERLRTPCFPLPSPDVFATMNDKWAFTQTCIGLGLPVPRTVLVDSKEHLDLAAIERDFGYPVVVKPTNEGNCNGVVIAHSRSQLNEKILLNPDYVYQPLLVQEFIPGIDIDLSVLALRGRLIAAAVQRRIDKRIVFLAQPDYVDIGVRLLEATSFDGVAHFDGRLDSRDGRIKLVECNPRFWASITASQRCGINFAELGIDVGQGRIPPHAVIMSPAQQINPAACLMAMISSPFSHDVWTQTNLRGLRQFFADPLPNLVEEGHAFLHAIRRRRARKAAERTRPTSGRLKLGKF